MVVWRPFWRHLKPDIYCSRNTWLCGDFIIPSTVPQLLMGFKKYMVVWRLFIPPFPKYCYILFKKYKVVWRQNFLCKEEFLRKGFKKYKVMWRLTYLSYYVCPYLEFKKYKVVWRLCNTRYIPARWVFVQEIQGCVETVNVATLSL